MSIEDESPSVQPDLWVTARCLDDDLNVPSTPQDARQRRGEHVLVDAFVDKRSALPEGQETISLESRGTWYTLHAERYRGVTWHQRMAGVVWLAGAGYHRDGDRTDAYNAIRDLDTRGLLAPDRADYVELDRWRVRRLAEELMTEPQRLVRVARENPGEVCTALLAGRISVRVAVEPGDPSFLTVAMGHELKPGPAEIPKTWIMILLAAFFGEHQIDELSVADDIAGRPLVDETAYCYFDHG